MATDQTIRVSAKGDFNQLRNSLKNLQGDLRGVTGEIDKSARKGGFLGGNDAEASFRALDVFSRRYQGSLDDINRELEEQDEILKRMHRDMKAASGEQRRELERELQQREQIVRAMRDQAEFSERLYRRRMAEVDESPASGGGSGFGSGGGSSAGLLSGAMGKLAGLGKFAMGLAAVGGVMSMVSSAYQANYSREVDTLDLAQRLRGAGGRSGGSNVDLYREAQQVGIGDNMGYSGQETWQFLDAYTRTAGDLQLDEQRDLLKFGRGYGLASQEVAGLVGGNVQMGGGSPSDFADAIATSVAESGMTARISEVMETNNTLLQQMNTTLKDGSARQILAYQTTLDRIGLDNGMTQLTGQNGANIIGGLGGIYGTDPNNQWKWMGIQALQQYDPERYGNMNLFDLESSFEDGLLNPDNIPAMAKYIKDKSGGNEQLSKRILQKWLTDGGFTASKREASELWDATNGLESFSEDQMAALRDGKVIDSGAKYDSERKDELGQDYMDTDARFLKAMEQIGQKATEAVQGMKEGVTTGLELLADISESLTGDASGKIYDFITGSWDKLAQNSVLTQLGDILTDGKLSERVGNVLGSVAEFFTGKNEEDGIEFNTPQQKRQYLKEKEEEARYHDQNVSSEGQKLFEREQAGEKLTWSERQTLAEWATQQYNDRIATGEQEKKTPIVDRAASMLGELFQVSANALMEGGASAIKGIPGVLDMAKDMMKNIPQESGVAGFSLDDWKDSTSRWATWETNKAGTEDDEGDSDIGRFAKVASKDMSDFTEGGSNNLLAMHKRTKDMADDAVVSFDKMEMSSSSLTDKATYLFRTMYYKVANTMDYTLAEFKTLRAGLNSSIGGLQQGGGTGNGDVTRMSGVTAEELNKSLRGALSGKGEAFIAAGEQYGIDPAFLAAISMQETGGTSKALKEKNNVGGMMKSDGSGLMTFKSIEEGINAMASNLKRNYVDQGLVTPEAIQQKYAPLGATNDPDNLNSSWAKGVKKFWGQMGGGTPQSSLSGSSFFNGWQSRVTSEFGEDRGNRNHGGLDINGEQGDKLDALAGGEISFIHMDDGGKKDKDGKMNTRSGGTEVGVKMPDGNTYFYSHLSNVNPDLQVGSKVSAGDWIGDMGGDIGKPGSGSSTTGSHLHLGYMDEQNNLLDPRKLLGSMDVGDSDIGTQSSKAAKASSTATPTVVPTSKIEVTLKVDGAGASLLNSSTVAQLKTLVQSIMAENERLRLQINPTRAGYGG